MSGYEFGISMYSAHVPQMMNVRRTVICVNMESVRTLTASAHIYFRCVSANSTEGETLLSHSIDCAVLLIVL